MPNYNYPPTSRYYGIPTATLEDAEGNKLVYLTRRFIPSPDRFATLSTYTVVEGDRPDLVAAKFLGDSTAFWRVADANCAVRPEELTGTAGRTLRITLPEGIPGTPNS